MENDIHFSVPGAGQHVQNWKNKTDQVKKAEFIRAGEKLKKQLVNIEKDKNGLLFNKKSDFRMEYSTLEELEHKLTKDQKAEKVKIQQKLARIYNNVKGLQRQLKDVKPTPEFVDRLREIMEEAENAINTFKEEQRQIYEALMREEKTVTNELNALEKKIEMWAFGTSASGKKFKQGKVPVDKEMHHHHLPDEIVELEKFLQLTGGRQGGWDEYDHQVFLKLWTKHKGKPSYMDEAIDYFADRTKEDVQQHEKWYQEFLILEARKKESIQKWKMKKQHEKEKILAQKKPKEVLAVNILRCEEAQKQKAEEERKKRLEELEAWKRHKATEQAMKQAAQLQEEEEKEKRKQRERQRQLQVKLLLEGYSRQKREQEELLKLEKEKREEAEREEKKRTAAEEILKFQERDLHKLELKILEKQAKENEKIEKEKRLSKLREKVEINAARDPYRLYKPTKVWEERTKEIGPEGSGPLLYLPHKAVPSWRQGL
ncbi:coiled-coil domain-containing protein 112 isoform X2 [Hemicordylus capensis]|uniref:coiled-coil domain-containing protein 112 isoform X2 n=1 Tax=Hemicordylus capensis TaxID=884348 RepID=UPI0023045744|nr:coiled-coil domain-containing protein 112 isoform X2 [Hemicordylus capensis]